MYVNSSNNILILQPSNCSFVFLLLLKLQWWDNLKPKIRIRLTTLGYFCVSWEPKRLSNQCAYSVLFQLHTNFSYHLVKFKPLNDLILLQYWIFAYYSGNTLIWGYFDTNSSTYLWDKKIGYFHQSKFSPWNLIYITYDIWQL